MGGSNLQLAVTVSDHVHMHICVGLGWFYCLSCSMIVFLADGKVAYSQGTFIKLFAKQIKGGQRCGKQLHTRELMYPACARKQAHRRETTHHTNTHAKSGCHLGWKN
jgi:hypothetical protein